jgi:hypothetical protein
MRLAGSSSPVAVKRRAVDPVYTVKIFPVNNKIVGVKIGNKRAMKRIYQANLNSACTH